MKLFCIFAFERGACCIQMEDDGLMKFGCVGGSVFFLKDTHVWVCSVLFQALSLFCLFFSCCGQALFDRNLGLYYDESDVACLAATSATFDSLAGWNPGDDYVSVKICWMFRMVSCFVLLSIYFLLLWSLPVESVQMMDDRVLLFCVWWKASRIAQASAVKIDRCDFMEDETFYACFHRWWQIQLPGQFWIRRCILFGGLDIYCIVVGSYLYVLYYLLDLWDILFRTVFSDLASGALLFIVF